MLCSTPGLSLACLLSDASVLLRVANLYDGEVTSKPVVQCRNSLRLRFMGWPWW